MANMQVKTNYHHLASLWDGPRPVDLWTPYPGRPELGPRTSKVVLIYSGGLDSTVALHWLFAQGYQVYALSFDYGQKHSRELASAKAFCNAFLIPQEIINLRDLKRLLPSALTDTFTKVPEGHYADASMSATVVPGRNAIMLSIAWGYAASLGAVQVVFAAHAGDHPIYPDCRPEFVGELSTGLYQGTLGIGDDRLHIAAPFIHMDKAEIVALGAMLKVDWAATWSCYNGDEIHCGKCGTCVERKEAFELSGVFDPTVYGA